jgi:hypothetical protein
LDQFTRLGSKDRSTLSRLFEYAKVYPSEPRENFTTGALAGAIRHDPAPFLAVLGDAGLLAPSEVVRCQPFTQVAFAGAGTIDLVLQVETLARVFELWIEVKVDAPESGDQLRSYHRYIATHEHQLSRVLAVLSKDGLDTDLPLTQLRWRDLARTIARQAAHDTVWADLADYLEEIRMTDGATFPITVREAAALEDAVSLVRKANAVLTIVNDELLARGFPEYLHWKTHGWVTTKLYDRSRSTDG